MPSENTLFPLPDTLLRPMVEQALSEDLGRRGDITSAAVIAPDKTAKLFLVSREDGVIAGMDLARLAFQTMDPSVRFQAEIRDGQVVRAGQTLAAVEGNACALLAAERTALNYLTHLSGIATATARAVAEVAKYGTDIVCSRKTIPLLRVLQKYAVRAGGGVNHRMGLDDAVLIKDNHLAYCGSIAQAVRQAKQAVGAIDLRGNRSGHVGTTGRSHRSGRGTDFAGQHGRRNPERSGKPLPHANRPPPHRLLRSIGRHRLRPPEARGANRRGRHRPRLSDPQQPLVGHRFGFLGMSFRVSAVV
ncbi:putative nicotinate-nucleotide pyrophosphorylase [Neisseria meningitidis]|nr:putative nicotinate-nucleotide pyrophosphorylase [Neisseria meningitidis]